ncbi:MAG: UPF0175 family protein [Alphaproteobacteria bacterium]
MDVTIHTPDDLASRLGSNLSRRALEALALEEFRQGRLTRSELRWLLCFATCALLDGFLKAHGVYIEYGIEDLEHDHEDLRRLGLWDAMPVVVADIGPIHYLVVIGEVEILFLLFAKIVPPDAIRDELLCLRPLLDEHNIRLGRGAPSASPQGVMSTLSALKPCGTRTGRPVSLKRLLLWDLSCMSIHTLSRNPPPKWFCRRCSQPLPGKIDFCPFCGLSPNPAIKWKTLWELLWPDALQVLPAFIMNLILYAFNYAFGQSLSVAESLCVLPIVLIMLSCAIIFMFGKFEWTFWPMMIATVLTFAVFISVVLRTLLL